MEKIPSEGNDASTRSLDQLGVGCVATVAGVDDDSVSSARLGVLGFLPGRLLKLARTAPLGDPIAVDINGSRIGLRRADARSIRVREQG